MLEAEAIPKAKAVRKKPAAKKKPAAATDPVVEDAVPAVPELVDLDPEEEVEKAEEEKADDKKDKKQEVIFVRPLPKESPCPPTLLKPHTWHADSPPFKSYQLALAAMKNICPGLQIRKVFAGVL